ncbi:SDR family NAD(P)-dependent oxidoreductase [Gordonia sp. LSe1-13]|uniref:SDR family NAD(P)-dependent oxidoreductase n=1 Tax=Gordonia sesuvii TaxID=3116777 RepID=A0ABU7M9F5_9ACTN|nr:SDR family NAD(P)-dependent oxidoreductase [Gordonia sp. LSe1-13]
MTLITGGTVAELRELAGKQAIVTGVTDAAAVQETVDDVVDSAGRLDLMFDNAGIVLGGDTELLSPEQWNAIIDVNVRGVVHGVAAAYPHMVRRRGGHIVNTASAAGLMAAGRLASYVMSKHAVVGLSLALRSEAAAHGVGVTALCPGAVETPLLDKGWVGGVDGREFYRMGQGGGGFYPADRLADAALRSVVRNKALLVVPRRVRLGWALHRLSPALLQRLAERFLAEQRAAHPSLTRGNL